MKSTINEKAVSLSVQDVSKRYGRVQALNGISFQARPAEAIGLWGANGAGKTTLLKAVLGLIEFQGAIRVQDVDVRKNGKTARRSIGYVPQEAIFYDWSVQATLSFYARLKKSDTTGIAPMLEQLGLAEHLQKPVPALSGGLKQRLALAIALLADPPVLLLDEPTANLDAQARRDYLQRLLELRQAGKTILLASHRLEEIETLANRVLLLERGRLAETLRPAELRARLSPEVEMSLWVPESQRPFALEHLVASGLDYHLNGRGSIVTRVGNGDKMHLLQTLQDKGIQVMDFEIEA
jgi:ABC-2 type transport system ATP-binding protein/nitrous oxidase accessory protein